MLRLFFGLLAVVLIIFGLTYKFAPAQLRSSFDESIEKITGNTEKGDSQSLTTTEALQADLDILAKASNKYADGNLPLGDKKYVTDGAKKGYIYLCNTRNEEMGQGAGKDGPWIHGTTWNIKEKLSIQGDKKWSQAKFENSISGDKRNLSGNNFPTHVTGIFPVQNSDPAYQYDSNPNSIKEVQISLGLPLSPSVQSKPYCMGGEVGVMLTGVSLFNGFDAQYRDAAAHEVQDACAGHPQNIGQYHYHSLSSCINNVSVNNVIGFALDGFPITGPEVSEGKYLTTEDLDECHGMTSEVILDGKKTTTYHYVMTQDFPYSVSCFKGRPVSLQIISSQKGGMGEQNMSQPKSDTRQPQPSSQTNSQNMENQNRPQPPEGAFTSCKGESTGSECSFDSPNGTVSGTCKTPPNITDLVCVPTNAPR